jgi:hypothetical protein
MRRRLARRCQLVKARTRAKNEVHAALIRRLVPKPAVSDLFGLAGRRWLEQLELPDEERETVDGCLRQIHFLDRELAELERVIAGAALASIEARRLMTVPGVNVITATTFVAVIGDIAASARRAGSSDTSASTAWVIGSRACEPRTHLEARLGIGALRPRRGLLERSPPAGAAARLLRAHPRPTQPPDRGRCERPQARPAVCGSAPFLNADGAKPACHD